MTTEPQKKEKKKSKKKIQWTYYFAELLVVFIGVTAGFLLNSWREDQAEQKLEYKYLNSFYSDLAEDETDLDSLIIRGNAKEDSLKKVLVASVAQKEPTPFTEEQAQVIVTEMLYIEWFSPSNDTYEDMINSGNLNLISDYSLKEKISSYYKFTEEVKKVEQYFLDHMDNYGFPILFKTYQLYAREFISPESYQSLEFTNMVLGVYRFIQQNNEIYKEALKRNKELKVELERVLEKEK